MKIELIPVIEIEYDNQEINPPEKQPYWMNQNVWYEYRIASLKKAGFEDEFEPYLKGYPFYEPKKISDRNLEKIIFDHTDDFRKGVYKRREQPSCLLGGYILKIDGENKFFPQSCGDLSDIFYWEKLSQKEKSHLEGIPEPDYRFWCNNVIFDFSVGVYEEHFMPKPPEIRLEIDLTELKVAVGKAKIKLKKLSERVIKMNQNMNLGIDRIDQLLIWENPKHEQKLN